MEIAIEKLAVIFFVVIGLSHIVQPRAWAEFFVGLRNKGTTGSFINGWVHFPLGAVVVAFHNVWNGIPMVLTIMGWGWVLKGLIYFVFPRQGLKVLKNVSVERSWHFVVGGIAILLIAGLLSYSLISRQQI